MYFFFDEYKKSRFGAHIFSNGLLMHAGSSEIHQSDKYVMINQTLCIVENLF